MPSILDVVNLVAMSWKEITQTTIQNCWIKSGIITNIQIKHEELETTSLKQFGVSDEEILRMD
jgi:hypothetical protein